MDTCSSFHIPTAIHKVYLLLIRSTQLSEKMPRDSTMACARAQNYQSKIQYKTFVYHLLSSHKTA